MEKTLAIVKPDAFGRKLTGDILKQIEAAGLALRALKLMHLTRPQVEKFYEVHKARPFFGSLCAYMSSGPVVIAVLEGDRAIERWRELMGATDPAKAKQGTIRHQFGQNVEQNAVHGSDGPDTAAHEIGFFFSDLDIAS